MLSEDPRFKALSTWLTHTLTHDIHAIVPASSDASFRRYFRVLSAEQASLIAMDAPPERENMPAFLKVANLLNHAEVKVPQIFHYDLEQGFMLLEDFGNECYLDKLNHEDPEYWYNQAFSSLLTLHSSDLASDTSLPAYDEALLTRELGIFYEWFLERWLNLIIPESLKHSLNQLLISSALQQPKTFVHRDFHSRNLMAVPKSDVPGIIDFQDAVIGPITYDLVSLLKDCYIAWPEARVSAWRDAYWQELCRLEILDVDQRQFQSWFDLMGLQRHLKAIGIFARLNLRDGKPSYLADIPRTLGYVASVCSHYPALQTLQKFLQEQVLPAYQAKQ